MSAELSKKEQRRAARKRPAEEVAADRCFKCRSNKAFTSSRDGPKKPYCKECMSAYLEKLVRDGFFRSCGVPADTKVAVCCSGGANSLMMLNILGMIAEENRKRGGEGKIIFDLHVLLLDETGVIDPSGASPKQQSVAERFEKVATVAKKWNLPMLTAAGNPGEAIQMVSALSDEMRNAINGRLPLTDREELYLLARQRCLVEVAAGFGCHGIITGENAVVAATRALAALVRGRGSHVADEAGFRGHAWSRSANDQTAPNHITIYRPLRTVLPKEAIIYGIAQGLPSGMYSPAPCTGTSLRSLNRTLEAFMANLMIQFRSTVFNVLNAVEKMHSSMPGGDPFQAVTGNAAGGVVVASSRARNGGKKGKQQQEQKDTAATAPESPKKPENDLSGALSARACDWCGLRIELELDPSAGSGAPSALTTSFKTSSAPCPPVVEGSDIAADGMKREYLCYGCKKLEYELPRLLRTELPEFNTQDLSVNFPQSFSSDNTDEAACTGKGNSGECCGGADNGGCGGEGDDMPCATPSTGDGLRLMSDAEKRAEVAEFLLDDNNDDAE